MLTSVKDKKLSNNASKLALYIKHVAYNAIETD